MHAAQSSHRNLIKHSQAHLRTVTFVHVYTVAPLLVYTFFTSDLPVHLHLHLHVSYSTSRLTYDHRAFHISHVACLSHFILRVYRLLGHHRFRRRCRHRCSHNRRCSGSHSYRCMFSDHDTCRNRKRCIDMSRLFWALSNLQFFVVQIAKLSVLQPAFQHHKIAKIAIKTLQVVCDSPKGFVSVFVL